MKTLVAGARWSFPGKDAGGVHIREQIGAASGRRGQIGRRSRVVPPRAGPTDYGLVQLTSVAGAALPVAVKPNEVLPAAATVPLYGALRTVTAPLAPVLTPFQMLLMLCPPPW